MNVIIRLQNLPWSASALDIRQYFHGLAIPDGGVHIVGGELGDAFIAFSTDEDARQAMLMDGGKIKDVTVRLHLSSRSQMQKVIEDARQAALQPFMQIPASVPQTLATVQSTANMMNNVAQMNHMGGQMTSQMTSQMALTTGQMLQVLPGQLTQTTMSHSMLGAGQVAAPGRGGMPGVTSMGTASMADSGVASAATPLGAARFPFGNMVMGGAMMGGAMGVSGGAGAALPMAGPGGAIRAPARDSPVVEEDADDRKDDDGGRRRDRRERSRSRERRDRDRYRDRERSSYDRDRRRRSRERSRDRGRRRRSRSSSRSRDRQRRTSRDKRDHDRSNEGPALEGNAASGTSTGLLKTPERQQDGQWSQPANQINLRGPRDDGPASGMGPSGGSVLSGAPVRMGMSGPGGPLDMAGLRAPGGMPGNSLRGPVPGQGGLPMRNGPGGFSGGMGPGNADGVRRLSGPWMQRDNVPPDVDRRQDVMDDRRGFGGPGPNGPGGPGRARVNPTFNRPGAEGDSMNRLGMSMPGPNFMDRGSNFNRPGMGMQDHPMDRFRPNGFDRNAPMNRPIGGLMDRMRPNPVATPASNMMKDKFSDMDNGDEDYEEQDMDMEDPFPDTEEPAEEERNNQPQAPVVGNPRNPPFSGGRPEPGRDDRYPFRDDRYDRSRRMDRDRDHDRDYDRDRGRDRDRRDRDRYRPKSNERDRERKDSRYDRHGKDEFGRDKPDERYSKDRYKDRPPEPNTCIEIRNMATHTGYGDIRRFFHPLVIPGPGLKVINDDNGRRTGVAYIRFSSRRDRETALTYSKATLKGESVLISDLSDEIFENAVDSYYPGDREGMIMEERHHEKPDIVVEEEPQKAENTPQGESGNQYTCVVVHNAPNYAQDDDIRRLFKFCSLDVFLEASKEGRRQKLAYVKFKKMEDCKRFLFANSKFQIGNYEVKVVGCSEKEYEDAKQRVTGASAKSESAGNKPIETNLTEVNPKGTANQPETKSTDLNASDKMNIDRSPDVICVPDDDGLPNQDMSERGHDDIMIQPSPQRPLKALDTDCVCLRNLPPNAIDRDILDFFSDVGLVPLKIHIMVDYMRNPIGEAFCEFQDGHETARAATKHSSHMGKFVVNVLPVSRMEMNSALNITSEPVQEVNRGGPMMGGSPLLGGSPMMMGGGPGPGGPGGPPRPGFHGPPGGHFNHGGHPGFMGPRGPSGPGGPNGPSPLMRGAPNNHALLGPGPGMGHQAGPQGRLQLQDMSAEGFGRPGCVVACENIPFRAEIDDILEFFRDYNLNPDSVIRRFNERGLATGDARIAFNSPAEAQSAMRDLGYQKLQGRTIYMRLL